MVNRNCSFFLWLWKKFPVLTVPIWRSLEGGGGWPRRWDLCYGKKKRLFKLSLLPLGCFFTFDPWQQEKEEYWNYSLIVWCSFFFFLLFNSTLAVWMCHDPTTGWKSLPQCAELEQVSIQSILVETSSRKWWHFSYLTVRVQVQGNEEEEGDIRDIGRWRQGVLIQTQTQGEPPYLPHSFPFVV